MKKERDIWVDDVKILACILVVLGHFFQSMVKSYILPDTSLYRWFNATIYSFHVPLFFICSGFLYQKYSNVNSFVKWRTNILNKLIALGIPYVVFSFATWLLKKIFSSSVNTQIDGLATTLLENPTPPYWYLYILFIIFVITFIAETKVYTWFLFIVSLLLKLMSVLGFVTDIYAIDKTAANLIWFVFGMFIAKKIIPIATQLSGMIILVLFFTTSILKYKGILSFTGMEFVMGILACYSIIVIIIKGSEGKTQNKALSFMTKYTMPIFLMHTLSAAPLRSVLIKFGITSAFIHVLLGLIISFIGPIIAMAILEKLKPLDFIVYPNKYVRIKPKSKD